MKKGSAHHYKVYALARLLKIRPREAFGLVSTLFEWASQYARNGAIGRIGNQEIAQGADWHEWEDPAGAARFISALVEAEWLDEEKTHRLVIHDWSEHCEDRVHKALEYSGQTFWNGEKPYNRRLKRDAGTLFPMDESRVVAMPESRAAAYRAPTPPPGSPPPPPAPVLETPAKRSIPGEERPGVSAWARAHRTRFGPGCDVPVVPAEQADQLDELVRRKAAGEGIEFGAEVVKQVIVRWLNDPKVNIPALTVFLSPSASWTTQYDRNAVRKAREEIEYRRQAAAEKARQEAAAAKRAAAAEASGLNRAEQLGDIMKTIIQ